MPIGKSNMTRQTREIAEQVRSLPDVEKLALVDEILADLDRPDPVIDKVWAEESRRRWLAYKAGRAPTVFYAEVMSKHRRRGYHRGGRCGTPSPRAQILGGPADRVREVLTPRTVGVTPNQPRQACAHAQTDRRFGSGGALGGTKPIAGHHTRVPSLRASGRAG